MSPENRLRSWTRAGLASLAMAGVCAGPGPRAVADPPLWPPGVSLGAPPAELDLPPLPRGLVLPDLMPERPAPRVARSAPVPIPPPIEGPAASAPPAPAPAPAGEARPTGPLPRPRSGLLDRPIDRPPPPAPAMAPALFGVPFFTPVDPPIGYTGPSSVVPSEGQTDPHFVPLEDRWRVGYPEWDRYGKGHPVNDDYPYMPGRRFDPF